jgi:hypothetical protein
MYKLEYDIYIYFFVSEIYLCADHQYFDYGRGHLKLFGPGPQIIVIRDRVLVHTAIRTDTACRTIFLYVGVRDHIRIIIDVLVHYANRIVVVNNVVERNDKIWPNG